MSEQTRDSNQKIILELPLEKRAYSAPRIEELRCSDIESGSMNVPENSSGAAGVLDAS